MRARFTLPRPSSPSQAAAPGRHPFPRPPVELPQFSFISLAHTFSLHPSRLSPAAFTMVAWKLSSLLLLSLRALSAHAAIDVSSPRPDEA
jgi:hypothetical protein